MCMYWMTECWMTGNCTVHVESVCTCGVGQAIESALKKNSEKCKYFHKIFSGRNLKIWIRWIKLKRGYFARVFCFSQITIQNGAFPELPFSRLQREDTTKVLSFSTRSFAINWKTQLNSEFKGWRQSLIMLMTGLQPKRFNSSSGHF